VIGAHVRGSPRLPLGGGISYHFKVQVTHSLSGFFNLFRRQAQNFGQQKIAHVSLPFVHLARQPTNQIPLVSEASDHRLLGLANLT